MGSRGEEEMKEIELNFKEIILTFIFTEEKKKKTGIEDNQEKIKFLN